MANNLKEKQGNTRSPSLWVGLLIIAMGVFFLVRNFTSIELDNWWALFILIPAFASLARAWQAYQSHRQMIGGVRGPLMTGILMLLVAAVFLFGLNWGTVWPVFLVVIGIGMLLNSLMHA